MPTSRTLSLPWPIACRSTCRRRACARRSRYIEGLRNGQELGALLGYQLERGLHESHPGVELDTFIYTLRARFPLVSRS